MTSLNKQYLDYINRKEVKEILEELNGKSIEQVIEYANSKFKEIDENNEKIIDVNYENLTIDFESRMLRLIKLID